MRAHSTETDRRIKNKTKKAVISLLAAMALAIPLTGVSVTAPVEQAVAAQSDILPNPDKTNQAQRLLTLINNYRAQHGLAPVKYSETISGIAQDESDRAVREENLSHSGNYQYDSRAGNSWWKAGEISAANSGTDIDLLFRQWQQSPGHNAIMLDGSYTTIGIGITKVDGSLSNGKIWRLVSTIDFYKYSPGDEPKDSTNTVPKGSGNTGGYSVGGQIGKYYNANGGASVFGRPISPEKRGYRNGGIIQYFENDWKIYYSPATGVQAIRMSTGIAGKWAQMGYQDSIGYPISDEVGTFRRPFVYQLFKDPSTGKVSQIVWNNDTRTAFLTGGAIGNYWEQNFPKLGYAVMNEKKVSSNTWIQRFKWEGTVHNVAYQSSNGRITLLDESTGIGNHFANNGREDRFGIPTTNEYRGPDGYMRQDFSKNATIIWKNGQTIERWK